MKNSIYYKRISATESMNNCKRQLSEKIEKQKRQFFESGGEISQVETGVSGNSQLGVHMNNAQKSIINKLEKAS